eukprot:COSAG01_NODE_59837_length_298_cov_0.522613_1_plen_64_part_01
MRGDAQCRRNLFHLSLSSFGCFERMRTTDVAHTTMCQSAGGVGRAGWFVPARRPLGAHARAFSA